MPFVYALWYAEQLVIKQHIVDVIRNIRCVAKAICGRYLRVGTCRPTISVLIFRAWPILFYCHTHF